MSSVKNKIPLHPTQLEYYYDQLKYPDSPHYNIGGVANLKGQIDYDKLEQAIRSVETVFDVHDISLDVSDVKPMWQVNATPNELFIHRLDFSNDSDPEASAATWLQERLNTVFDFENNQFFEGAIIKTASNEGKFYLRYHHLLSDALSFTIAVKHIAQKYSELMQGIDAPVERNSYLDEIEKSTQYLDSEKYSKNLKYWLSKFDYLPAPVLNKKRNNDEVHSHQGETFSYNIPKERNAYYANLKETTGIGVHHLMLMALYVYFGKIRTDKNFVLGSTAFKRRKGQWDIFGLFAGALPFKMSYDPSLSARDLVQQIKSQLLKDYRHQSLPVSHLNRELNLNQQNREMLFEIIINYLLIDFDTQFENLETDITDLASNYTNVPLMLWWRDYGPERDMELRVDYNLNYLQKEEIELLLNRLFFIMDQFESKIDCPVDQIDIIPTEEKSLIKGFNQTDVDFSKEHSIISYFEQQVKENPEAIAIRWQDKNIDYQTLNGMANQISHYLTDNYFVSREDKIAIQLERNEWMIAAILGVLKSGAAYVPIDPKTPTDRLNYILEEINSRVLLNDSELDFFLQRQANYKTKNPNVFIKPVDLAYLIFTSGTTGKPKGIMIEHRNLVDYALSCQQYFSIDANEVVLQQATLAFDTSIEEIFPVLIAGGTLAIAQDPRDLNLLLKECEQYQVTLLSTNPYVLHYINDVKSDYDFNFRILISGGDVLKPEYIQDLYNEYEVYNTYGPTESTVCATYHKVNGLESTVPIGQAIGNRQVYIFKPGTDQMQPLGVEGEIVIAGKGLARGYWELPELTDQKFIRSTIFNTPSVRMYRTGDLGYQRPDGEIVFSGRIDDQVKIRGFRIELGEIESVLTAYDKVTECKVITIDDHQNNKQLVAYLVASKTINKAEFQMALKTKLPYYMVPAFMIQLDALPLNVNGKIDKKALPLPDISERVNETYFAPESLLETKLAALWKDLLGLKKVSIHDSFFDLGGDSLKATRIISAIQKKLGKEIRLIDFFEQPTIHQLALLLQEKKESEDASIIPVRANRPELIPLSYSQEFIWFVDKREGSTHHHIPGIVHFEGVLDFGILEKAFKTVLRRHEVLRTVINEKEGELVQVVMTPNAWSMEFTPAKMLKKNEVDALIQDEIELPFDLTNDFMLRVHLFETGDQEFLLALVMHHIASDGWSVAVLVREVIEAYHSMIQNRPADLNDLSLQYIDFVLLQRQSMNEAWMQKKLDYWKRKLSGVSYTSLVTDYDRRDDRKTNGEVLTFSLDKETSNGLRQLASDEGATLFMTLLTVLKTLLFRYNGQEDICIGSPIANRTHEEWEHLIGYFLNTIALRTDLSHQPTFSELLNRVKLTTLEAYENQEAPFEKVIEEINPERHINQTPLFQIFFNLLNHPREPIVLDQLKIELLEMEETASKFDLSFYVNDLSDEIRFSVIYDSSLFAEERITNLAEHYQELAKAILLDPNEAISNFNFLSAVDQQNQSSILEDFFQ